MSLKYNKRLIYLCCFMLLTRLTAQPNWEWQKRVGEHQNVKSLTQLIVNQEGDIVVIGTTRTGGVYFGIFEPTTGGLLSQNVIFSKNSIAHAICQTRDGGYVVVGETTAKAAWLAKLDASGLLIWEEFYGGAEARSFASVLQDTEGSFYLAGFSGKSFRVFKISRRGVKLWETDFSKEGKMEATDLAWTKNGRLVAVGFEKLGNKKYRGIIKTLDVDGHILTERSYETTYFSNICIASNGDWLISGVSLTHGVNMLLLRTNSEGNEIKRSVLEQKTASAAFVLAQKNNGSVFIAGEAVNKRTMKRDAAVLLIEADGAMAWQQPLVLGSSTTGQANGLVVTQRMAVVGGETGGGAFLAGFATPIEGLKPSSAPTPPPPPQRGEMLSVIWTKPDVELQGNIFTATQGDYPMTVKALSSKPLAEADFTILLNGQEVAKGSKFDNTRLDSSRNGQTFIYTYSSKIPLSIGDNLLQIAVKNGAGSERTKQITVRYNPRLTMNLHILSIGIPFEDLKYTTNDAADIVKIMESQGKSLFKNVYKTLLNTKENTSKTRIIEAIEDLRGKYYGGEISDKDVLIISISSHGFTADNDHTRFRISAADYSQKNDLSRSLDFENDILNILNEIKCKKIILIDACHSGAAENPLLAQKGNKGSFFDDVNTAIDRLMKIEEGTWCIVSSSAEEKSWEDAEWQNGAFTEALSEAAYNQKGETQLGVFTKPDTNADNYVTLSELFDYIKARVTFLVAQKKHKPQTPRLIMPKKTADFPIFYVK
jgi:hypothetical protein